MKHSFLPAFSDGLFPSHTAPEAAFSHPGWLQAAAAALKALEGGGITVLIGPSGCGKSLLLQSLACTLRQAGKSARLIEPLGALKNPPSGGILLVDEADTLGADAIATLGIWPTPVLIAARPGFPERLAGLQYPVRRVALDTLSPQDVARYVAARLNVTCRAPDLLEREAVLALAHHSGGLLQLVNIFGRAAVLLAELDGSPQVGVRHVEEAASMRDDCGANRPPLPKAATAPTVLAPIAPVPITPAPALRLAASPLTVLRNYSGGVTRRRAALGTMFTASGLLFALPWLSQVWPGALPLPMPAAGDGPVVQASRLKADNAVLAVADVGSSAPDGHSTPMLQAQPEPGTPQELAATTPLAVPSSPLHAEPVQPADTASQAAMADDRRLALAADGLVLFQGPIYNETMGQSGHVTLVIHKQAPAGAITARFTASQGLSGSGVLAGSVSGTGRITASGQLRMGRNPFDCHLSGMIVKGRLTGTANFVRSGGNGWAARSTFTLTRA